MADDRRNGPIHRAAFIASEQDSCPIPDGEMGLWNDGGVLTYRQDNGNDVALTDLSLLDYAEAGDMAAAGLAASNSAGTSDEVSRGDHVHATGKQIAAASALLIADPGDGQAIAVTHGGVCALTSGASGETRTLAIPTFLGQRISLSHDVDGGGAIEITVAADFDQSGNDKITMQDAGDFAELVGVQVGGSRVWRLVVNVGCTLS